MKVLFQPRGLLLAISLLISIFGLLTGYSTIDFHLHDTYFVVSTFHIGVLVSIFFLLQATIYFLTDNYRQWCSIQYFHVLSTTLIVLAAIGSYFYSPKSFRYADFSRSHSWPPLDTVLAAIFLLGQILFVVNLIAGFIPGKKVLNHVR